MAFKYGPHNLDLSKANAMKYFIRLENCLRHIAHLVRKYSSFSQEWIDFGHLEKVQLGEINNSPNFYLPRHYGLKEDSTTTKLRVVFDASAKTTTGISFSDFWLVDPKLKMICSIFSYDSLSSRLLCQLMQRRCIGKLSWIKPGETFIGFFGDLQLIVQLKFYACPELHMA